MQVSDYYPSRACGQARWWASPRRDGSRRRPSCRCLGSRTRSPKDPGPAVCLNPPRLRQRRHRPVTDKSFAISTGCRTGSRGWERLRGGRRWSLGTVRRPLEGLPTVACCVVATDDGVCKTRESRRHHPRAPAKRFDPPKRSGTVVLGIGAGGDLPNGPSLRIARGGEPVLRLLSIELRDQPLPVRSWTSGRVRK